MMCIKKNNSFNQPAIMPGVAINEWGPCGWMTLHAFAHAAPDVPSMEWKHRFLEFLRLFAFFLPCPKCKKHFASFVNDIDPLLHMNTKQDVIKLLNEAHNNVNKLRGTRVFSFEEHEAYFYKKDNSSRLYLMISFMAGFTSAVVFKKRISKNRH